MDPGQLSSLAVIGAVCGVLVVLFAAFKFIGERKITYNANSRKAVACAELLSRVERGLVAELNRAPWRVEDAAVLRGELKRLRKELDWISTWRYTWFHPFERKDRIDDLHKDLFTLLAEFHTTNDAVVVVDSMISSEEEEALHCNPDISRAKQTVLYLERSDSIALGMLRNLADPLSESHRPVNTVRAAIEVGKRFSFSGIVAGALGKVEDALDYWVVHDYSPVLREYVWREQEVE